MGDVGKLIERFAIARPQWTHDDVRRVSDAVDAIEAWNTGAMVGMADDATLRDDARVLALRAEVSS